MPVPSHRDGPQAMEHPAPSLFSFRAPDFFHKSFVPCIAHFSALKRETPGPAVFFLFRPLDICITGAYNERMIDHHKAVEPGGSAAFLFVREPCCPIFATAIGDIDGQRFDCLCTLHKSQGDKSSPFRSRVFSSILETTQKATMERGSGPIPAPQRRKGRVIP